MRTRPLTPHRRPGVAPAVVLLGALLLTGCGSAGSGPVGPVATAVPVPSSPTSGESRASGATVVPSPAGLVPLWPFTTPEQVRTWQTAYRASGSQPWHLDADQTALSFTRGHLRYTEIDRVTSRVVLARQARIGVGSKPAEGRVSTAAVLHLVRFGVGADAPWVVVGSDDTLLTVTAPGYGSVVTSPLTAGGRITGVDESLHVVVVGPLSSTPVGEVTGIPAGGERTPWTARVAFRAAPGTVLTVAVSTGGHVSAVERFAITAVRAG